MLLSNCKLSYCNQTAPKHNAITFLSSANIGMVGEDTLLNVEVSVCEGEAKSNVAVQEVFVNGAICTHFNK